MSLSFPFYRQRDAMDCGPACLMMIAAAWGRKYPLPLLRERSYISREGVSAMGIMDAATQIGLRAMTVKVPFETEQTKPCLKNAPLPCIAHWNQNHFVVVYKANKKYVWIADPGTGKIKLSANDFQKNWCSDDDKGILILLEPTPAFYDQPDAVRARSRGISQIFQYLKPYRKLVFQVFAGMLTGSTLVLVFPFLTQSIVDFGIDNKNVDFIYMVLGAQMMLFMGQMMIQFLQSRILLFIGARINVSMVNDFLTKLIHLPIGYFDTKMAGDLMQRIGDQSRIESFLTNSTLGVLFSALNFVLFNLILFAYNPLIFTIYFSAAFLYVMWIFMFLRKRKEIDYIRFQQSSENNNNLIELIQGMQEIKLQGSEQKRRLIWTEIQSRLFNTNLRAMNLMQWQEAGAGFFNQAKNILITFLAANAVIEGEMTLGMMLSTQYMVGMLDGPLQQFIAFIRITQDAKISLDRMAEIQDQPDEDYLLRKGGSLKSVSNKDDQSSLPQGDLIIEQVSFRYNQLSENILTDISIRIPTGKVTAIVGASGSGKTTLLKLLLGFYPPTKGEIRVGSRPMHTIYPREWRKNCGTVMQDGFVFSDTIANNISESDDYPNPDRLNYAVNVANIESFIHELPLGYNTNIGSRGNGISQGQRQRLLIARAVYKNPDYLFFDEATNALDANNERIIVENLTKFYTNDQERGPKTVIIVAHRLSTVTHADQIIVLDKGRVAESGTHTALVHKKGYYYQLVKNQLELGN